MPEQKGPAAVPNKVLIFSRDSDTLTLLKTLLELWGFRTVVSQNLADSLLIIERDAPDLILLDSVLPFETNLEYIRRLRRQAVTKEISIIVLSGFSQSRFESLSIAVGADAFLVKPMDFDLLQKHLEKTGRHKTSN